MQTVERHLHCFFCFFDRETRHRTACVEHKDDLLWRDVLGCESVGRLEHESEKSAASAAMGQHGVFDPPAGNVVTQDEILVWNGLFVFQRDLCGCGILI